MSMYPSWPSTLPQLLNRQGAALGVRDARTQSQSDDGFPHARRRYSSAARPKGGTMTMTWDQWAILERWWDEDLVQGVQLFWFPVPALHGWPLTHGGAPLTYGGVPLHMSAWRLYLWGKTAPAAQPISGAEVQVPIDLWELP